MNDVELLVQLSEAIEPCWDEIGAADPYYLTAQDDAQSVGFFTSLFDEAATLRSELPFEPSERELKRARKMLARTLEEMGNCCTYESMEEWYIWEDPRSAEQQARFSTLRDLLEQAVQATGNDTDTRRHLGGSFDTP